MEHSVAYLCRVLGQGKTTPTDVAAYRTREGKGENYYPVFACGARLLTFWQDYRADDQHELHKRYWMGSAYRSWVEQHLAAGHVALVHVHRIPTMWHAVALLEADAETVLLMDPLYGFKREPWAWFLGPGAGKPAHMIDGWYYREEA
jgi:hypothetical protein